MCARTCRARTPTGRIRSRRGAHLGALAADARYRSRSIPARRLSRDRARDVSCRRPLSSRPSGRLRTLVLAGVVHRSLAERRNRIQPPARTVLACGDVRIFPMARQHAHLLEPAERAIESPVGGEELVVADLSEGFRDFVAVKLVDAAALQRSRAGADGELEGDKAAWFSPHRRIISRYMR